MNWSLYTAFLAASLLILMLPGPSMAYAIAVAGRSSRRAILLNVAGMGLGGLVIVLLLAVGLAKLLVAVPAAYTVLQVAGCTYMCWLGVVALRQQSGGASERRARIPAWAVDAGPFLQGFLVETANPKTILFFSAMIPQFVDPAIGHVQAQLLILGCTFLVLQVTWDASLMLLVLRFRQALGQCLTPAWQRWARGLSGVLFIGIGVAMLFHDRPKA